LSDTDFTSRDRVGADARRELGGTQRARNQQHVIRAFHPRAGQLIYYGDNIPEQPSTNPAQEQWRVFRATARLWRDAVNTHGGNVTLVELPAIGIRGNTHFPMSDLNNVQIADLLSKFLADKGLQ
jgi:hypothetical protein